MHMRKNAVLAMAFAFAAAAFFLFAHSIRGASSADIALNGQVSSVEEGPMEGVLVSAKRAGSTVTTTVVSDGQGRYTFPAKKLEPGQYAISIRATGYEVDGPAVATITSEKTTAVDLKLHKTQDLAAHLTNAEWLASVPGTQQQKNTLLSCVGCHTVERIVRSKYDAAGFIQAILPRMASYVNQSTPLRPQLRLGARDTALVGEEQERVQRTQAEWLSNINLSSSATWAFPLKTLPRPKGQATRVIITEYDLPRPTIEPHDVIVDGEGIAWYSNFGEQTLGKLDPKTGKHTEHSVPEPKKGSPTGALSVRFDKDQNLWLGMMYQASIAKFDKKAETFQVWNIPSELNKANTQINMTSPMHIGVDGKVWAQNNGFAGVHRVDLKSGKWETWDPFKGITQRAQYLRCHRRLPEQRLFHRYRERAHRQDRCEDRQAHAVRDAHPGLGAAPGHDGCAGPSLVR